MRRLPRLIGLVSLCSLAAACGPSANAPPTDQTASTAAPAPASTEAPSGQPSAPAATPAPASASPPAEAPSGKTTAALAELPAPYNTGDPANGQAKFAACQICHTVAAGGPNMTGPNLHGIFGRKAGSLPDFNYSDALKGAGWTWDAQRLDAWLESPAKVLPGTKMTFAGLPNPKDRSDVIAYLKIASGS